MRVNEYKELKDFIYEYESGRSIPADNLDRQKFMGIEFKYNDVYYRYSDFTKDKLQQYDVILLHCEKTGYPQSESYELIGWYADLDDVLENCMIQGRKFKDVIMDEQTEILGKD